MQFSRIRWVPDEVRRSRASQPSLSVLSRTEPRSVRVRGDKSDDSGARFLSENVLLYYVHPNAPEKTVFCTSTGA